LITKAKKDRFYIVYLIPKFTNINWFDLSYTYGSYMKFFFRQDEEIWGSITYSGNTLKFLVISKSNNNIPVVKDFVCFEVLDGKIVEEVSPNIKNKSETSLNYQKVHDYIKNAKNIILAIPGEKVFSKQILVDKDFSQKELKTFVKYQAEKICEGSILDFDCKCKELIDTKKNAEQKSILITVVNRQIVQEFLQKLSGLKLLNPIIDTELNAFARASNWAIATSESKEKHVIIFVNVESDKLLMICFDEKNQIYSNKKHEFSLDKTAAQCFELASELLHEFLQTIKLIVSKVVLSGDISSDNLCDYFASKLGIPTVLIDSYVKLKLPNNHKYALKNLFLNYGLFLWDENKQMDLFPKPQKNLFYTVKLVFNYYILFLASLLIWHGFLLRNFPNVDAEVKLLRNQMQTINEKILYRQKLELDYQNSLKKYNQLAEMKSKQEFLVNFFVLLGRNLPTRLQLVQFKKLGEKYEFIGETDSVEKTAQFLTLLENNQVFSKVEVKEVNDLVNSRRNNQKQFEFSITAHDNL
jgi:hypothetical protein